jgi:chromosome segregation ATPase
MKSTSLKITSFLFIILFSIQLLSQTVKTTEGIFIPISIDSLKNSAAARSAKQVAELAIVAVTNDSKKIAQKREKLQPEIDKLKEETDSYNTDNQLYIMSLNTYQKKVKIFDTDHTKFNIEDSIYMASLNAYKSLPKENRSKIIFDQLDTEADRLEPWLERLKKQKAELNQSLKRLNTYKADLNKTYQDLSSKYEKLKYELNEIDIELKNAQKQLQMLFSYSLECNKILQQWKEPVINTYILYTQLEKLKALSNKGWN